MTKLFSTILICVLSSITFGQSTEIKGTVRSETKEEPLSFVTVKLLSQSDSSLVTGMFTDSAGSFAFKSLPAGQYMVKIAFFGFQTHFSDSIKITNGQSINLGIIDLKGADKILNQVNVISKQDIVKYEIDKKVINVSQDYANTSATAFEVLENVPSVSTDIDGNLSLRGSSSYTLFIDGKPSLMEPSDALKMIPASNIEDIEIMTNPSSKYDAEGVSGIINIITKKNKVNGTSAMVNLGGGLYNAYNADATLQIQRQKFTFNLSANFRNSDSPSEQLSTRTTRTDSSSTLLYSEGTSNRGRGSYGATVSMEYRPNERNALNASYEYSGFFMSMESESQFSTYYNDDLTSTFLNVEDRNWDFRGSRVYLDYFHYFNKKKSHYLSLSGFYRGRNGDESSLTEYYYDDATVPGGGNRNTETGPTGRFRFKIDYQLPFKNGNNFLAGLQSDLGFSTDYTNAYVLDSNTNKYVETPLFSTDVDYTRDVHAAYTMFNGKFKKLGYQLGLRAEYTDRVITPTNGPIANIERLDIFPTIHTSYQKSDKTQFILSYSRKIERPRSWYMEPFITWVDLYSVRTGNIDLIPEYVNSFEFGWIQNVSKKTTFSFEAFHRQIINKIERIQRVYEADIVMTMPENVGVSNSTGIETSLDHVLKTWWRITATGTAFNYSVKGEIDDLIFDQQAVNWTAQLTNSFSLTNDWKIQLMTNYNSSIATAQGFTSGFFRANLAVRKSFWNKNATATLQMRDVFSTTKNENTLTSNTIQIYSLNEPRTPTIILGLALKFNNYKERRQQNDNGDDF
jgi:outer membrane cobalamin receptor